MTCADMIALPEDIGAADSVEFVVYVSEDVDGLLSEDVAICSNTAAAYNVESILTLTCQTPTEAPTASPTNSPSESPSAAPTEAPTASPTPAPTKTPTPAPTSAPSASPTSAPTKTPTAAPTNDPSASPTAAPTKAPTAAPSPQPTMDGCDFSYLDYVDTCYAGQDWYWIVNGDGDDGSDATESLMEDECTLESSTNSIQENAVGDVIGTQCCEDSNSGVIPYRNTDDCTAAEGLTFVEAENFCSALGFRLCTRDEIATIGFRGLGCNFEAYLVWTSDLCGPSLSGGAAHVPKLSFPEADPVSPAVSIDLPSKWMAGVVTVYCLQALVLLLAGAMCYKARSERVRTKKYAKVIAVDSEDFTENEARAINVE